MGDLEGQETFLSKKVDNLRPFVSDLQTMVRGFEINKTQVRGSQEAYAIYTKAILPKLSSAVRLHHPDASLTPCNDLNDLSRSFARTLAGDVPLEAWGELQDVITHLPVNAGGLGLTDLSRYRVVAHFASVAESASLGKKIIRPVGHDISLKFSSILGELKSFFISRTERLPTKQIQKALSEEVKKAHLEEAKNFHATVGRKELVLFHAKTGLLSSWLYIQPWEERILAESFTLGVKVWLNLPLTQICRCGDVGNHVDLHHLLSCKHGRVVIAYHNAMYSTLARHLRTWCGMVVVEEPHATEMDDSGSAIRSNKRYDFSFWPKSQREGQTGGFRKDADFIINSPFSVLTSLHVSAAERADAMCEKSEMVKRRKYKRADDGFIPLAMGSLGYVGPSFLNFLSFIKEKTPGFMWDGFLTSLKVKVLDFIVLALTERLVF